MSSDIKVVLLTLQYRHPLLMWPIDDLEYQLHGILEALYLNDYRQLDQNKMEAKQLVDHKPGECAAIDGYYDSMLLSVKTICDSSIGSTLNELFTTHFIYGVTLKGDTLILELIPMD